MAETNSNNSLLIDIKECQNQPSGKYEKFRYYLWSKNYTFGVKLLEGVCPIHFWSYLFLLCGAFSFFYYFDICMILLLRDPDYYNMPAEAADVLGTIIFIRSIMRIVVDPIAGSVHDLISRKWLVLTFLALLCPAFIAIPLTHSVYPSLLIYTLVIGLSMSIISTTPILTNLVCKNSMGLSMALVNLSIDLSRVIAIYCYFSLHEKLSIRGTFLVVSGVIAGLVLLLSWTMRPVEVEGKTRNLFSQMMKALTYSIQNKIFLLFFLFNFISYIFIYFSGIYLAMFIVSFYSPTKMTEAQRAITHIKGIGNLINVFISGFFGFIADRVDEVLGISITTLLMAGGAIGFLFVRTPDSVIIYMSYILLIIGLQSSRVMGGMMLFRKLPKEFSGGLAGLNIFSGTLGMLTVSKLGSHLFTTLSPNSVYGAGALLSLGYLIVFLTYIYRQKHCNSVSIKDIDRIQHFAIEV